MNSTRLKIKDKNQTLIMLTALEDEGDYVCNASNRIGSDVSTYSLIFIGMYTYI